MLQTGRRWAKTAPVMGDVLCIESHFSIACRSYVKPSAAKTSARLGKACEHHWLTGLRLYAPSWGIAKEPSNLATGSISVQRHPYELTELDREMTFIATLERSILERFLRRRLSMNKLHLEQAVHRRHQVGRLPIEPAHPDKLHLLASLFGRRLFTKPKLF